MSVDVHPARVAVILAAGRGERLRPYDGTRPKPLIDLLGVSLAERVVRGLLAAAPIEKVVVSLGYEADRVRTHFESVGRRCGVSMEFVTVADWQLGNGASALAAEPATKTESFLLTMSDHVFTPDLVLGLIAEPPCPGGIKLAVDRDRGAIFDLDDVTRVQLSGERITAIGKGQSDGGKLPRRCTVGDRGGGLGCRPRWRGPGGAEKLDRPRRSGRGVEPGTVR